MRYVSSLSACAKAAFIGLGLLSCQADQDVEPAGISADCLVKASANNGQIISGSYIVTYKPEALPGTSSNARMGVAAEQLLSRYQVADAHVDMLASGEQPSFLAHLTEAESVRLQQDPAVERIEPDRIMSICNCVDVATTSTLSWNISQTGYGRGDLQTSKTVWVIDTGIDLDHPDLNVDAERSVSFITGKTPDDENGHGTHVAGIIGAKNNSIGVTGIASGARLVSLKVLNQLGEGRLSGIIQAVNHVVRNGRSGDVVNLSLGGEGTSATLDRAIRQAADAGILFAIAAGNESEDADTYSPARVNHPNVFTVSAMDRNNRFASFSNFGSSVDVCAYGVRISSTYKDGRYATLSGTSMAAPHVAGLLLIRGSSFPTRGYVQGDPDGQADPIAGE
ncbi:peptidase S8 and S53 subtilisin kexin sedolisin [Fibrisoma limi BUZ 3]|uniref:Peptidase S8 and S53 subtilisin kexin sedolisin n=1 Tax=Fibrisoma limi BUZ 3 TaxID=1185876 RepID=I2GGG7_9BACT|nr:S8 family peptidase [Fibrisoma limi]CCH52992.1 peptidase S8 and S53 subtilisin kexin sedolisin [Fibrisoma limi BUZ 3]